MLRTTSFLTLFLFTLSIFIPFTMHPQSADAECIPDETLVGELFNTFVKYGGKKAIKSIWKKLSSSEKKKQSSTCEACGKNIGAGSENCAGASEICSGNWSPPGCGGPNFPCESNHSTEKRCKNKKCKDYNDKYRQCVGHTCNNKKKKSSTSLEDADTAFSNWYWFAP